MDSEKFIFWFEETGKEHNNILGKKCANLGESTRMGFPVPPGFSISIGLYRKFLERSGARKEMEHYIASLGNLKGKGIDVFQKAGEVLQGIIFRKEIQSELKDGITSHYEELCKKIGISKVAVAVRSAGTESRPGMFDTYLNVRGADNVLRKVKEVWASAFTPRAIAFRAQKDIPMLGDELGICIVKMVNAKSAGIGFTVDPITGDDSEILIEANWGLGEGVVTGSESIDKFVVDKESLVIKEKEVGKKIKHVSMKEKGAEWEYTRSDLRSIPCLSYEEIVAVAKLALKLESVMGGPQDIEWAFDSDFSFPDNLFLLQTRTAKVLVKKLSRDQLADRLVGNFRKMDLSKAKDKIKNVEFKF